MEGNLRLYGGGLPGKHSELMWREICGSTGGVAGENTWNYCGGKFAGLRGGLPVTGRSRYLLLSTPLPLETRFWGQNDLYLVYGGDWGL